MALNMYKIIKLTCSSLLFTFLFYSSVFASTGLRAIASFAAFAVYSNVIVAVFLITWFVIHWSNKTTQNRLVYRTIIDTIVIVLGSFSLWFWGKLFFKLSYGDGLWKAITNGYGFIFHTYKIVLFFIFIIVIIYLQNKWISSISRISRYFIHFFLCILSIAGILALFTPNIAGPVTKWFVNYNDLIKIDNPIESVSFNALYGFKIDKKIALSPDYTRAFNILGYDHFYKGEYEKAISDFLIAIESDPSSVTAYKNISWLLSTCVDERFRDGMRAIDLIEKAIKLRDCRNNSRKASTGRLFTCAESFKVLAAAYAEVGKFEEAITTQKKAISLQKKATSGFLSSRYEQKSLESYKDYKPLRDKGRRFHRFAGI